MSFYAIGNLPITSTQALAANPTTGTLLAEIEGLQEQVYEARIIAGGSTLAELWIEQCLSTGLGSTALRTSAVAGHLGRRVVFTPTQQSAQFIVRFRAETSDRIRARVGAGISAGSYAVMIQLEPMT